MRAGELIHRITIRQSTESASADSGFIVTDPWTTVAQRWAAIDTGGGREFNSARGTYAELTHLVRMPGFLAVTPKMRVLMADGRELEIGAAYSPDGRPCASAPEIWLACVEIL